MAAVKDNLARKQISIPANMPEEEIVLRVAAYCRVSTDSDDQINSFTAQNSHYMEMITAHDRWELVDIYADAPDIIGLKQNPTRLSLLRPSKRKSNRRNETPTQICPCLTQTARSSLRKRKSKFLCISL